MTDVLQYINQSLDAIQSGLGRLMPELVLTAFALMVIIVDLAKSRTLQKALPYLTLSGLLTTLTLQVIALVRPELYYQKSLFLGLLTNDGIALYAGILFVTAALFTIFLTIFSNSLQKQQKGRGEYNAILIVLVLGLNLLAKSVNLLMVFVALELVSVASYLLVLVRKEKAEAVEAGLKYILYGAVAAGIMAYGMSFLYGFTGSLYFTQPEFLEALAPVNGIFMLVVAGLIMAGFLFKIGAAPFHFWAPDVYEGAPTPIAAFFSVAPKAAGVLVIYRFAETFRTEALFNRFPEIWLFLGGIALITMVVGNFTALGQKRPKRLLAYSSVSHAGFLLAGLLATENFGIVAVLFYLTILLFSNFGIFLAVQVFEEELGLEELSSYSGFGRTYPLLGVLATLFLISLTGLPPTAGFTAKLFIFTALWQEYTSTGQVLLLVLLGAGLILTAVAFFYYIRLPYYLFFKRNLTEQKIVLNTSHQLLLMLLALPVLLFFFKADWLLNFIENLTLTQP